MSQPVVPQSLPQASSRHGVTKWQKNDTSQDAWLTQ
jgi:hypothetical protein